MPRRRTAFTLVELLVVVAILSLLLAILIPSLSGALDTAGMVREMAAGRQVQMGHLTYAEEHDGTLLPGWVGAGHTVTDPFGNTFGAPISQRYPWRLAPYLDEQVLGTLLVGDQEKQFADADRAEDPGGWAYGVSSSPSFGYNYHYVGGDRTLPSRSEFGDLYLERLSEAFSASGQIVFGSAHSQFGSSNEPGHHRIEAPTGSPINPPGWSAEYDPEAPSPLHGYVHARHPGEQAVFTFLDGHAEAMTPDDARDMQMWADPAARAGDPEWAPE